MRVWCVCSFYLPFVCVSLCITHSSQPLSHTRHTPSFWLICTCGCMFIASGSWRDANMLAAGEASLQDAWLREVQRRATMRGRRANFVPFTNSLELPQAISDDLASFIEEGASTGGGGLPALRPIPASAIDRLPLVDHAEDSAPECAICMAPAVKARRLPCGHCYHKKCLVRWLGRSPTCPTCRANVPLVQRAPITASTPVPQTNAATPVTSASATRRRAPRRPPPLEHLSDGGVIVRRWVRPPAGEPRPARLPEDAELLIVRYPTGTARVWRARNGEYSC